MDGADGVGGGAGGAGGVGGVGDASSSDASGVSGVADAVSDAVDGVAEAVGAAVGAAVSAVTGNEALGASVAEAVEAALDAAIGMAIGAALGGPLGLGVAAFGGFATDKLGDIVDNVTQDIGNHFGLDQAVIDGMQAAGNMAVGDRLGAMTNVGEMMDELGVSTALGNPAAFSQMERDLSGFLSL